MLKVDGQKVTADLKDIDQLIKDLTIINMYSYLLLGKEFGFETAQNAMEEVLSVAINTSTEKLEELRALSEELVHTSGFSKNPEFKKLLKLLEGLPKEDV